MLIYKPATIRHYQSETRYPSLSLLGLGLSAAEFISPVKNKSFSQAIKILLLVFFTCIHSAYAKKPQDNTVIISTPEWIDWSNADGSGFYLELLAEIYNRAGYHTKADIKSFKRSRDLVRQGGSDIVIGVFKRSNKASELYTPYYPIEQEYFVAVSSKDNAWRFIDELKDKRILIPSGYLEEQYMPFTFKRINISDGRKGLRMIASGKEKYLILTRSEVVEHAVNLNLDLNKLHMDMVTVVYTYLGFTNNPRGRELAKIYDQQLPILINNGTVKALYDKRNLQPQTLLELAPQW